MGQSTSDLGLLTANSKTTHPGAHASFSSMSILFAAYRSDRLRRDDR